MEHDKDSASDKTGTGTGTAGFKTVLTEAEQKEIIRRISDLCLQLYVARSDEGRFSVSRGVYVGKKADGKLAPMPFMDFDVKMLYPLEGASVKEARTRMVVIAAMGEDACQYLQAAIDQYETVSEIVKGLTDALMEQFEHEQDEAAIKVAERFKA